MIVLCFFFPHRNVIMKKVNDCETAIGSLFVLTKSVAYYLFECICVNTDETKCKLKIQCKNVWQQSFCFFIFSDKSVEVNRHWPKCTQSKCGKLVGHVLVDCLLAKNKNVLNWVNQFSMKNVCDISRLKYFFFFFLRSGQMARAEIFFKKKIEEMLVCNFIGFKSILSCHAQAKRNSEKINASFMA